MLEKMGLYYLHQWLFSLLPLSADCFKFSLSNSKVICLHYCKCIISLGMHIATCIGKRLPNTETDVPSNVQILDLSSNSISTLEKDGFKVIFLFYVY
jgi:hypothetical protein